jgi:HPt (histidine-containing phosphotransfer) domain-containing protein
MSSKYDFDFTHIETSAKVESDLFDLADDYLAKRKLELGNIPNLVESGDYSSIESIGHKLQGNADLFGLNAIAQTGRILEDLAKERAGDRVVKLAEQMLAYLGQVEFVQDI